MIRAVLWSLLSFGAAAVYFAGLYAITLDGVVAQSVGGFMLLLAIPVLAAVLSML